MNSQMSKTQTWGKRIHSRLPLENTKRHKSLSRQRRPVVTEKTLISCLRPNWHQRQRMVALLCADPLVLAEPFKLHDLRHGLLFVSFKERQEDLLCSSCRSSKPTTNDKSHISKRNRRVARVVREK